MLCSNLMSPYYSIELLHGRNGRFYRRHGGFRRALGGGRRSLCRGTCGLYGPLGGLYGGLGGSLGGLDRLLGSFRRPLGGLDSLSGGTIRRFDGLAGGALRSLSPGVGRFDDRPSTIPHRPGVRFSRTRRPAHSLDRGAPALPASVPALAWSGRGCNLPTIRHPLGLRPLHCRGTATLPHKLLPALHKRLGRLLWYRLTLNASFSGLDGQSVRRSRPMASRRSGVVTRGSAGGNIPRLDLRRLQSHPWGRSLIRGDFTGSVFSRPNLGRLRSGLWHRRYIRTGIIMYSGLPRFDTPLLHPLPRG